LPGCSNEGNGRKGLKWFKHFADAFLDEGVNVLIEVEGFAGYGRWCRLQEIVAFKMDESDRCHVEYTTQKWCELLRLKKKGLSSFLELIEKRLETNVTRNENKIRIEIPKLLEQRDNYTKNLQATDKKLVTKEVEVDVEEEVEEENIYTDEFLKFWDAYPRKVDKKRAAEAFKDVDADLHTILEAVEAQKQLDEALDPSRDTCYIPYPESWLKHSRWEDELA
jgi:hypothetical protein